MSKRTFAEQVLQDVNAAAATMKRVSTMLDEETIAIVERWRGRKSIRGTVALLLKVADEAMQQTVSEKSTDR